MNKDYKGTGYPITNEPVTFASWTDDVTGITGTLFMLEFTPAIHTLELWTGLNKTGTKYTVQLGGSSPDTDKVLILEDGARGLLYAGSSIPTNLYAFYTTIYGSPIRAIEQNQAFFCRAETFALPGSPWVVSKTYVQGIKYPVAVVIEDITVFGHYAASSGTCVIRVQDAVSPTNHIDVTIADGQSVSSAISGTLVIPTTGELVVKIQSNAGSAGEGWIRIRFGILRRK